MPPPSKLCLTFIDRLGIVADLVRTLSEHAISITAMEVEVDPDTHRVRIYLALDTRQGRYPWQDVVNCSAMSGAPSPALSVKVLATRRQRELQWHTCCRNAI